MSAAASPYPPAPLSAELSLDGDVKMEPTASGSGVQTLWHPPEPSLDTLPVDTSKTDPKPAYYKLQFGDDFTGFSYYVRTLAVIIGRKVEKPIQAPPPDIRSSPQPAIPPLDMFDIDSNLLSILAPDTSLSDSFLPPPPPPPEQSGVDHVDVDLGPLKSVSRNHAKIEYRSDLGLFCLEILGRNGAWVDDRYYVKGSVVPLKQGSVIQIATRIFSFILPPSADYPSPYAGQADPNSPLEDVPWPYNLPADQLTYTEFFDPPVPSAGHVPQPFNAFAAADGHGLGLGMSQEPDKRFWDEEWDSSSADSWEEKEESESELSELSSGSSVEAYGRVKLRKPSYNAPAKSGGKGKGGKKARKPIPGLDDDDSELSSLSDSSAEAEPVQEMEIDEWEEPLPAEDSSEDDYRPPVIRISTPKVAPTVAKGKDKVDAVVTEARGKMPVKGGKLPAKSLKAFKAAKSAGRKEIKAAPATTAPAAATEVVAEVVAEPAPVPAPLVPAPPAPAMAKTEPIIVKKKDPKPKPAKPKAPKVIVKEEPLPATLAQVAPAVVPLVPPPKSFASPVMTLADLAPPAAPRAEAAPEQTKAEPAKEATALASATPKVAPATVKPVPPPKATPPTLASLTPAPPTLASLTPPVPPTLASLTPPPTLASLTPPPPTLASLTPPPQTLASVSPASVSPASVSPAPVLPTLAAPKPATPTPPAARPPAPARPPMAPPASISGPNIPPGPLPPIRPGATPAQTVPSTVAPTVPTIVPTSTTPKPAPKPVPKTTVPMINGLPVYGPHALPVKKKKAPPKDPKEKAKAAPKKKKKEELDPVAAAAAAAAATAASGVVPRGSNTVIPHAEAAALLAAGRPIGELVGIKGVPMPPPKPVAKKPVAPATPPTGPSVNMAALGFVRPPFHGPQPRPLSVRPRPPRPPPTAPKAATRPPTAPASMLATAARPPAPRPPRPPAPSVPGAPVRPAATVRPPTGPARPPPAAPTGPATAVRPVVRPARPPARPPAPATPATQAPDVKPTIAQVTPPLPPAVRPPLVSAPSGASSPGGTPEPPKPFYLTELVETPGRPTHIVVNVPIPPSGAGPRPPPGPCIGLDGLPFIGPSPIKPTGTFASIIFTALANLPRGRGTLGEVCNWIAGEWEWFRLNVDSAWQNSIRHNLSLNKAFLKVPRIDEDDPESKGSVWIIDPTEGPLFEEKQKKEASKADGKVKETKIKERQKLEEKARSTPPLQTHAQQQAQQRAQVRPQTPVRPGMPIRPTIRPPIRPIVATPVRPPVRPAPAPVAPPPRQAPEKVELVMTPITPAMRAKSVLAQPTDGQPPPFTSDGKTLFLDPATFGHMSPDLLTKLSTLGVEVAATVLNNFIESRKTKAAPNKTVAPVRPAVNGIVRPRPPKMPAKPVVRPAVPKKAANGVAAPPRPPSTPSARPPAVASVARPPAIPSVRPPATPSARPPAATPTGVAARPAAAVRPPLVPAPPTSAAAKPATPGTAVRPIVDVISRIAAAAAARQDVSVVGKHARQLLAYLRIRGTKVELKVAEEIWRTGVLPPDYKTASAPGTAGTVARGSNSPAPTAKSTAQASTPAAATPVSAPSATLPAATPTVLAASPGQSGQTTGSDSTAAKATITIAPSAPAVALASAPPTPAVSNGPSQAQASLPKPVTAPLPAPAEPGNKRKLDEVDVPVAGRPVESVEEVEAKRQKLPTAGQA